MLLPDLVAVLAEKAHDAEARVIDVLAATGKTAVIPSKANRTPRGR